MLVEVLMEVLEEARGVAGGQFFVPGGPFAVSAVSTRTKAAVAQKGAF